MIGAETAEAINRRIRVANELIRQAVKLIEAAGLSHTTRGAAESTAVDPHLIADLQLSTTALRRAWNGAGQA